MESYGSCVGLGSSEGITAFRFLALASACRASSSWMVSIALRRSFHMLDCGVALVRIVGVLDEGEGPFEELPDIEYWRVGHAKNRCGTGALGCSSE